MIILSALVALKEKRFYIFEALLLICSQNAVEGSTPGRPAFYIQYKL